MRPVVTPEEMAAIDASAPEATAELVDRAGAALAHHAVAMMGGTYGRRVVVVAGKGNNGADGIAAATRLRRRGARVEVIAAAAASGRLGPADLVIDAAYGTGLRGRYEAPDAGGAAVLAADIASGVDGLTGAERGRAVQATLTLTFAALKPGLLFHPGRARCGRVVVADIGLDVSRARTFHVERTDALSWIPPRPPDAHKWQSGLWVVAGSASMAGAAELCSAGAQRAGAGIVVVASPGAGGPARPPEAVGAVLPGRGWDGAVLDGLARARALVIGPGLGRSDETARAVRRVVAEADLATVVDADGLWSLGGLDEAAALLARRRAPTVLTPHDGELARLLGRAPTAGEDRLAIARDLAERCRSVVLLKGSTTVVADPGGRAYLCTSGDVRLATAGTGDVLAGVIGAFLARGMDPARAAIAGAVVHGEAARLGPSQGLVASDLLGAIPRVLGDGATSEVGADDGGADDGGADD